MLNPYQEDLAYIHDQGFGDFAQQAAPYILELLNQRNIHQGLILDIGCGSGILTKALTDQQHNVIGIDLSPAMIELAKQKAPSAQFIIDSFINIEIPPCQAVIALGEVFNYQFDQHNFTKLIDLFTQIYNQLSSQGILIFDIIQPGIASTIPTKNYYEQENWTILVETQSNPTTHQLTRDIIIFRKIDQYYRKTQETHTIQLYQSVQIATELNNIGFKTQIISAYGQNQFRPHKIGFIATKE